MCLSSFFSLSGPLKAADWRSGVLLTEAAEHREMRLPLPAQEDFPPPLQQPATAFSPLFG